jgi:hypothetical protein
MTFHGFHYRSLFAAIALAVASVGALCMGPANPSLAAEDEAVAGFLNPFPEGEIYQLSVIGDTFAEGILYGLAESMGADTRLNIQRKVVGFWAIMSGDFQSKAKTFEQAISSQPMGIAIVMMGEADRVSFRNAEGRRVPIASPDWVAEYTRRLDGVMKTIKRKNAAVYWVGLPNLSRIESNEQAQVMNEAIRERAYLNGFKYIDAAAGFADESGAYSPYGPDLAGKIRVLRDPDGVHFTEAGNRKLAYFVEKELRRDLNQAKSNRNVPLLGAEAEQAKINPDNAVKTPAPSSPVANTPSSPEALTKSGTGEATAPSTIGDGKGDQKSDNGKITLQTTGANGQEETASIEIVRPPISASVVALMARRDSAGQSGDLLVDQIAGGLTLMSSIAPTSKQTKGKQSPTQAPYFRLLVKGERLLPKAGRADDVSWPANADSSSRGSGLPSAPRG